MTHEEFKNMGDTEIIRKPQELGHAALIDEVVQEALRQESRVSGELIPVASMQDLAPDSVWSGDISASGDSSLNAEEEVVYDRLLAQALVIAPKGSQIGCMDGREIELPIAIGPKTAAGTLGNAYRLMLASVADESSPELNIDQALDVMAGIDESLGYKSGTHAPGQCGAHKFSSVAVRAIAETPEETARSTEIFLGAVGYSYSPSAQSRLTQAALDSAHGLGETVVDSAEAAHKLHAKNATACPELLRGHEEKKLVVMLDDDVTLDNNKLIASSKDALGKELQAFGYSWGYHLKVSEKLGGSLGDLYLHSVASQDVPVLMRLTDGSLPIVAFKKS